MLERQKLIAAISKYTPQVLKVKALFWDGENMIEFRLDIVFGDWNVHSFIESNSRMLMDSEKQHLVNLPPVFGLTIFNKN